jgi:MYXO-CTERM domain-containing protein
MPALWLRALPLCAAGVVSALTSVAGADISSAVFIIQASNSLGTAQWQASVRDGDFAEPGMFRWTMRDPVELTSATGERIATINSASLTVHEDPDVALNFNVASGVLDTVFTITSAQVSFATIGQAEGRASASINATDLGGDGVSLQPSAAQSGAFTTRYNGVLPGGSVFHDFFDTSVSTAVPGGTVSVAADYPGGGAFSPIAGAVTNISSRFSFSLSAQDVAAGTSFFRVQAVPSPTGAGLLGLAGLVAVRRRRS